MLHTAVSGDLPLEGLNFGAEDEVLRVKDARDSGVDLRLDLLILRAEIEKGELQGSPLFSRSERTV